MDDFSGASRLPEVLERCSKSCKNQRGKRMQREERNNDLWLKVFWGPYKTWNGTISELAGETGNCPRWGKKCIKNRFYRSPRNAAKFRSLCSKSSVLGMGPGPVLPSIFFPVLNSYSTFPRSFRSRENLVHSPRDPKFGHPVTVRQKSCHCRLVSFRRTLGSSECPPA